MEQLLVLLILFQTLPNIVSTIVSTIAGLPILILVGIGICLFFIIVYDIVLPTLKHNLNRIYKKNLDNNKN